MWMNLYQVTLHAYLGIMLQYNIRHGIMLLMDGVYMAYKF